MNRLVHIVAIGARTPVGLSAEGSAAAVRAGISRIGEHPFMVDLRGERVRLARDGLLDPGLFGAARPSELVRSALGEVVAKLSASPRLAGEVPLLVGLPEPRPGFGAGEADALARELGRTEAPVTWSARAVPLGRASALEALRQGCELVVERRCDLCVVGGADSWLDPDALLWLDGQGRLAAPGVRTGFPPGEGAAFLALAGDWARRQLGLPSLAVVRSVHRGRGPKAPGADNLGEGLAEVIAATMGEVSARGEMLDEIYGDLNGEREQTEEWGFAALRLSRALGKARLRSGGLAAWGDTGAATGALLAVLAVETWRRGYGRGQRALLWASSSFEVAALLEKHTTDRGRS